MSFQQALSGLNAAARNLDVIGHNIANSGTTGFKSSRAEFAEAMASAAGSASGQSVGIGTNVAAITQQFKQGGILSTGNNLDVAINGNGFFMLRQSDGSPAFTRAGNFHLDKNGSLKTISGDDVLGYKADPLTGKSIRDGSPQPMAFSPTQQIPAKKTTKVDLALNLDARANNAAGDPGATPPIAATPRAAYGTSLNTYDSQGVTTPMNFYFEKNGANSWDIYNQLNNNASAAGRLIAGSDGKIVGMIEPKVVNGADPTKIQADDFATDFTYKFYGPDASTPPVYAIRETTLTFANAADAWDFTFDTTDPTVITGARLKADLQTLGTPPDLTAAPKAANPLYELSVMVNPSPSNPNSVGANAAPGLYPVTVDLSNVTQFGSNFSVSNLTQDGYGIGTMTGLNIGKDGAMVVTYSNGIKQTEGYLALAEFTNPQGLAATGDNKWVHTSESGDPIPGIAQTGTLGTLQSGALEESNVDLTAELVNMMTAQRAYQSNAQAIKTQDQVFSTLVNLR